MDGKNDDVGKKWLDIMYKWMSWFYMDNLLNNRREGRGFGYR